RHWFARTTAPLMVAFRAGVSPPAVRMPMRFKGYPARARPSAGPRRHEVYPNSLVARRAGDHDRERPERAAVEEEVVGHVDRPGAVRILAVEVGQRPGRLERAGERSRARRDSLDRARGAVVEHGLAEVVAAV